MRRKLLGAVFGAYLTFLGISYLVVTFLVPCMLKRYLYTISSEAAYKYYLHNQFIAIQNVCYLLVAIVFVLSLFPLTVFHFKVYSPLNLISEAASQYMEGASRPDVAYDNDDELGRINATLKYLVESSENSGEYQRKLISNISHDFRSPLTSIKGYVEAILDGTIPPEQQAHYLQVVLNETERLNKLTSGILLLNTFDENGIYLEISEFDINEAIRQVITFFEGVCQKKNLTIVPVLPDHPVIVSADRDRILQVLYNLIDNAIKFSPTGREIRLNVSERNKCSFVSIRDFGEGINPEDLPKIWDRFYKTDPSRGRDRKGTGLGLAIAKEIIRAHNQNIDVISTVGIGTEFTFSLATPKGKFSI